jgi:hypothetical protein
MEEYILSKKQMTPPSCNIFSYLFLLINAVIFYFLVKDSIKKEAAAASAVSKSFFISYNQLEIKQLFVAPS